jgi:acetyltransferase-like isoleucine patch superfamily enzyme
MTLPPDTLPPACWTDGELPPNVDAAAGTTITGPLAFKRFRSRRPHALTIGANCTMTEVQFAVGERGVVEIGAFCYFTSAVVLCELSLQVGSYVVIGWNATIADTDFHPIDPALRIADAVACSPLAGARQRPPILKRPVIIEDDVWIGPNATILKGVRIGAGAFVEPGALVTRDVPPRSRVAGNPAEVIGQL